MKTKSIFMLVFVFALCLTLATAPLALAADPVLNEDGTLTITEPYPATEDAPALPETLMRDGKEYALDDTEIAADPHYVPPSERFTRTAFSQVPLQGKGNWPAYFPATYAISEGAYQGEIGLDPATPFTVAERYEVFRNQVDRSVTFYNLPDNDVARIPGMQDFEVRSSAAPGATEWRTLQRLDVSYVIAGTDHLGLPNNYTAVVTYRGQEEYLELHHYDVTANYAGSIASTTEQRVETGIYSPVPAPVEEAVVIPDASVPTAQPELPVFPLALTGSTLVIILALPLIYLFFLCNARLIKVNEHEEKVVRKLVCRRRLVLKGGTADFAIPATTDILDGSTCYLTIKSHFARRGGEVRLIWQEKVMAVLPLAEHASINFRELLITSAEAVLRDMDILEDA